MNPVLYIDLETTGLKPKENAIVQIAALVEIDGKIVEKFNENLAPMAHHVITPEALEINNLTLSQINGFQDSGEAFKKFIRLVKKYPQFKLAGYNVRFDISFLQEWFDQHWHGKFWYDYFDYKPLDVFALELHFKHIGLIDTEDDKLETVCKYFGIKHKAHDAMGDIKATRKLHKQLLKRIQ